MKNKKNEELQSRREFFKKAAKGALPILIAVLLAAMPLTSKGVNSTLTTYRYGDSSAYSPSCTSSCINNCIETCEVLLLQTMKCK